MGFCSVSPNVVTLGMKLFSRQEFIAVSIILVVIIFISLLNFRVALRRGRDNERENDVSDIAKMLDEYKSHNQVYPASLANLPNAPKDPGTPQGHSYLYITDGKLFQLYASLEGGTDESISNSAINALNFTSSPYISNFYKSPLNTPLHKSP